MNEDYLITIRGTMEQGGEREKGRRHVCHYETGHGSLSLGVAADEIQSRLSDKGGTVQFSYLLDVDASAVSRNTVKITVKPAD